MQFASRDDPFLPWEEQEEVARGLGAELHEYADMGHFQGREFLDLLRVINGKIDSMAEKPAAP